MAEFTIELGALVKDYGYPVVEKALSEYPVPEDDPKYRENLNAAILRHYWMNEIGQETPDLFCYYLNRAMCEIMPYYNERRRINMLDVGLDPLTSYERNENFSETLNEKGTSNSTTDESGLTVDTLGTKQTAVKSGSDTTARTGESTRTDDLSTGRNVSTTEEGGRTVTRTDDLQQATTDERTESNTDNTTTETNDTSTNKHLVFDIAVSNMSADLDEAKASAATTDADSSQNNQSQESQGSRSSNGTQNVKNTGTVQNVESNDGSTTSSESGTQTGTVKNEENVNDKTTYDTTNVVSNSGTNESSRENSVTVENNDSRDSDRNGNRKESGYGEPKFILLAKYREIIENLTLMIIEDPRVRACFIDTLGCGV